MLAFRQILKQLDEIPLELKNFPATDLANIDRGPTEKATANLLVHAYHISPKIDNKNGIDRSLNSMADAAQSIIITPIKILQFIKKQTENKSIQQKQLFLKTVVSAKCQSLDDIHNLFFSKNFLKAWNSDHQKTLNACKEFKNNSANISSDKIKSTYTIFKKQIKNIPKKKQVQRTYTIEDADRIAKEIQYQNEEYKTDN